MGCKVRAERVRERKKVWGVKACEDESSRDTVTTMSTLMKVGAINWAPGARSIAAAASVDQPEGGRRTGEGECCCLAQVATLARTRTLGGDTVCNVGDITLPLPLWGALRHLG